MANYVQPIYNITVNIWRQASQSFFRDGVPPGAPSVVSLANLSPGRFVNDLPVFSGMLPPPAYQSPMIGGTSWMTLRLPAGTDIQDIKNGGFTDIVEAPAGSGRVYLVVEVDDIGAGFANEHRYAKLAGMMWPVPFPRGAGPYPPPPPPVAPTLLASWAIGGGGPVNTHALACTPTQTRMLVCVARMNQLIVPTCDWNGGAQNAQAFGSDTGNQAFGLNGGGVAWYVVPCAPGAGFVNVNFAGFATGLLAVYVYEWAGFTGVFGHIAIQAGPLAPQTIAPWAPDMLVPQIYFCGNLAPQPGVNPSTFQGVFATPRGSGTIVIGGIQYSLQMVWYGASVGGVYNASKSLLNTDAMWAMSEASIR